MDPSLNISTIRELWQHSNEQHWLPVKGISMLPLLREGDSILVSHDLSTIRRGDILVFQQGEGLVAHRVVRIAGSNGNARTYQTKGDNCTYFDAPLSTVEVLGRVNSFSRDGKEYNLTTPIWHLWNSILAIIHLMAGRFFQILRFFKHRFLKK